MEKPAPKNFDVYDFKDEEQVELSSRIITERLSRSKRSYEDEFRVPMEDDAPITKYQFLQAFSSGMRCEEKNMNGVLYPNDEPSDCSYTCKDSSPKTLSTSNQEGSNKKAQTSKYEDIPVSNNISQQEDTHTNPDVIVGGNTLSGCITAGSFGIPHGNENPVNEQMNCRLSEISSNNNSVGVISDDEGNTTFSADMEYKDSSASDHCSSGSEMETTNMEVVTPDFLLHKDLYSTESSVSFCCSCVKVEGVNANGSKEMFSFEWDIVDVMGIDCLWCARIETAIVKLCISSAADLKIEAPSGTSGVMELKFAVYDPRWFESQEEIMKVDARYKNIWRVLLETDPNDEGILVGKNQLESCFPCFDEHFEDVIYPEGDPDAVSISRRDVELLQPETFINDTIIDFYIKYLTNNIKAEDRNKFHFFNSFFFRKLADLDKNPSSASDGRAAFFRVRKWTRKVKLFEKNYVFIPINFSLHWSLIVICHPGEIPTFRDEEADKALRVPCILHMDSIKGSHKGLKDLVQSYLWEEWKERQGETSDDVSYRFLNLRFVSLELPQQENSFDCGLFLLHYVERFLEEAPADVNPFKLSKFSNFLNSNWFHPAEASLKRSLIQRLIYKLLENHSHETTSTNHDPQHQTFESKKNKCEKVNGVEYFLEDHVALNSCTDFGPNDGKTIEIELLSTPGAPEFVKDSGLVLKGFLDKQGTVGSVLNGRFQSIDHNILPIKDNEETDTLLVLSTNDKSCFHQLSECKVGDGCTGSYSLKDNSVYDASLRLNEDVDFSSSESNFDSDSSEVMIEGSSVSGLWHQNRSEITGLGVPITSENNLCTTDSSDSSCNEEQDTRTVEDSQEVNDDDNIRTVEDSQEVNDDDNDEKEGSPSSCQENDAGAAASFNHCQVDLGENEIHPTEKQDLSEDVKSLESDEQRASKRARLTLPPEECQSQS